LEALPEAAFFAPKGLGLAAAAAAADAPPRSSPRICRDDDGCWTRNARRSLRGGRCSGLGSALTHTTELLLLLSLAEWRTPRRRRSTTAVAATAEPLERDMEHDLLMFRRNGSRLASMTVVRTWYQWRVVGSSINVVSMLGG
jgi:hypothetical protein